MFTVKSNTGCSRKSQVKFFERQKYLSSLLEALKKVLSVG